MNGRLQSWPGNHLLTQGAEIIVDYGHSAIGVERNMRVLVNKEVVAWTLANSVVASVSGSASQAHENFRRKPRRSGLP